VTRFSGSPDRLKAVTTRGSADPRRALSDFPFRHGLYLPGVAAGVVGFLPLLGATGVSLRQWRPWESTAGNWVFKLSSRGRFGNVLCCVPPIERLNVRIDD